MRGNKRRKDDDLLVSVVLDPGHDEDLRAASVASLEAQTHSTWELVDGLDAATGEYVAFLDAADVWVPGRLARLLASRPHVVADRIEGTRANGERVLLPVSAWDVEAAGVMVRRRLLLDGGGIDPLAGDAWVLDFLLRNEQMVETTKEIGVRRRFPDRRRALRRPPGNQRDAVLNRHLVDWSALEVRAATPGLTSVLVPTYEDAELTTACVESLMSEDGPPLEVIIWDNGSAPEIGAALDGLASRFARVQVHHAPTNHGFALGNNLALQESRGDLVVFLNNDTTVASGWLAPLRGALEDPEVLGVQPLLVYPTGTVQSAGVAFPSHGGLPHAFLNGFPVEDATGVGDLELHAITGAALALRREDAVALHGFDPLFTNGMEDVDLCHRLVQARPGHFRVVTDVPVVHHESRTPGRFDKHLANRQVYLSRWGGTLEPRDDAVLWGSRDLDVVDHQITPRAGEPRHLAVPQPVLVRRDRLRVRERPSRLRWAIKNPAPAGDGGLRWGDTHFADSLAAAFRARGHDVVIDPRPEWGRASGRHDDVALVLRGLHRYEPSPTQVTLAWVISHPDDVTPDELRTYDGVAAASTAWSERVTRDWGIPVTPLLQATDPERFHPGAGAPGSGPDVLFVGNSRRRLRPVVRDALAAGLPLRIYGALWTELVPDGHVVGTSLPNEELAAAYASAGVVLNDHWDDMREAGFVSNRLFDAVASGARVISDGVAGVADLFGASVQVYDGPDDLARLATLPEPDAVFGDAEARRRAAERVRREHSFLARVEALEQLARTARAARGFRA